MSAALTGLLQPQITKAVTSWTATTAADPTGAAAAAAQQKFILELSQGIALAVQTYLNTLVLTVPLPTGPAPGPVVHFHPNLPHKLTAP